MNKLNKENMYNDNVYLEERRIIQEAKSRNKLVLFVGAGISIPAGLPSWSEVIEEIQSKLGEGFQESDFLKVPQYYYNEHGKNNYTALMRKIFKFGKKLYPRSIHRKILDFQTQYIITTNYDNLLEDAAFERNEIMDIIACDKDLSYGIAGKKLIKMHGDFEHDNFVLKEDDYLHYSMNFRLIETYIKALIAGNIVLFIGYSFNDPDLKQIFAWVKEVLGSDMPQSYIIEINEDFSSAKTDYFKNYGIKILYASEKIKDFQKQRREKNTEMMLDFLHSEAENISQIDNLYQYLKPFQHLNYVCNKYIKMAFQNHNQNASVTVNQISPLDNECAKMLKYILYSNKKNRAKQNNNRKNPQEKKAGAILSVLRKSSVTKISTQVTPKKGTIIVETLNSSLPDSTKELVSAIFYYDFDKLKRIRDKNENVLSEANPLILLEQAFVSYCLQEYKEAHQYLKTSARLAYHSDMYEWYFISLLNRKCLAEMVRHDNFWNLPVPEKDWQESLDIDMEKVFLSLPDLGNDHNRFLRELYTFQFFYTLFPNVYHQTKKIAEEASRSYSLYIGTPEFVRLEEEIKDIWQYVNSNYLLIERYKEYVEIFRIYGKQILESSLAPDMPNEDSLGLSRSPGSIRPKEISVFSLHVILQYLPLVEIKKAVLELGNKQIPIGDDGKDYLTQIIPNLSKTDNRKYGELFYKILYISSHIELTSGFISLVIKALKPFAYPDIRRYGNEIANFFYHVEQYCPDITDSDEIAKDLHQFLEGILSKYDFIHDDKTAKPNVCNILYTGISLYKKIHGSFESTVLLQRMNDTYIEILGYIYPLLQESEQSSIRKLISDKKWDINGVNIHIIGILLKNKAMTLDDALEDDLLNYVSNLKDDRETTAPSRYEIGIEETAILYAEDCLKQKDKFFSVIKKSGVSFAEWIADTQNFDYDNFDFKWLEYCSPGFLTQLKENERAVQSIRKQAKEIYLKGFVNHRFIKIYFEYFAL